MKLTALKCQDRSWEGAGFDCNGGDSLVQMQDLDILFEKGFNGGLQQWGWDSLPSDVTAICGIPAFEWKRKSPAHPVAHRNGATSVDHVVLHCNSADFVKEEFKKLGVDMRAERNDIYPGITQLFYRPGGGTVIEVVINKDFPSVPFLWGLTVVVADIDQAKLSLGDNASQPKTAVQPGRKILTVKHEKLDMKTNMAMMTPHVKKSKL